jgi:RNA polymerase sigma-70 factor (ECF subfamily)
MRWFRANTGDYKVLRTRFCPFNTPDLLLSPIVLPAFPWEEWQSQYFESGGSDQIMNSADQFEAIVCEHYETLFRFAMSLTRAESDAWDLTQQTFHVWATKGHQLNDISKVKTWLFTTLHREFLKARRKQGRLSHFHLEEVADQLPVLSTEAVNHADCCEVLLALRKLDDIYQAPVALFYLDDCSYKDIALVLEVPLGTVKSRIARGIMQLRGILSDGSRDSPFHSEGISSSFAARDERAVAPAGMLIPSAAALH